MRFFKPEDFENVAPREIWEFANAKLESKGWVVYSTHLNGLYGSTKTRQSGYKGILINVEPLVTCKHPKEKVSLIRSEDSGCLRFACICGVYVQAKEFEEVE